VILFFVFVEGEKNQKKKFSPSNLKIKASGAIRNIAFLGCNSDFAKKMKKLPPRRIT
jgi:hypothetical protein